MSHLLPGATAIVLAGGRSSRMGRPKALLPFDGQPLIVRLVRALRGLFAEVVIVAAHGQELPPLRARTVRDSVEGQGPARAIYDGLAASTEEVAFVTACDAAWLNPGLVSYLVSRIDGYEAVVPYWEGRLQPLHAVYRVGVLPELAAQLRRGELRPALLLDRVLTRTVGPTEITRFDPDGASFSNLNTPEDYAAALARYRVA